MSSIPKTIKYYVTTAFQRGFSYIFVSSMVNKFIVLASTVLLNRFLSQEDYGYFSYAYNIISMIIVVSSLGVDLSLLQFCCENRPEEDKRSLQKYALYFGIVSNVIVSVLTFLVSQSVDVGLEESMLVLSKLSFILPFPFLISYSSMILRSRLDNKKYALLTNVSSIAYLGCVLLLIQPFGINGAIVGRYIGFVIPSVVGLLFLGSSLFEVLKATFPNSSLKKEFLGYGITVTLTNSVSSLLYYIDIHVVGLVTSSALSIAAYKTATIIPNALAALPAVIVTFIYPYFAKNKDNRHWVIKNTWIIQLFVFGGSSLVALLLWFLAPQIIVLFFGQQYLASVLPFRILLISFVISGSFRVITGNVIAMLGRVRVNFYIGLVTCLLNIIVDFIFIKAWGSIGAAIATTLIMVFASILSNIYLYLIYGRKTNTVN